MFQALSSGLKNKIIFNFITPRKVCITIPIYRRGNSGSKVYDLPKSSLGSGRPLASGMGLSASTWPLPCPWGLEKAAWGGGFEVGAPGFRLRADGE